MTEESPLKAAAQPSLEPGRQQAGTTIDARAVLLGDRLSTAGLEREQVVATAPIAYRVGDAGLVVVFRYGVVVLFGLSDHDAHRVRAMLAPRANGWEPETDEETVKIVVRPEADEQVTADGAIQVRTVSNEQLLIVADVLAKSVALARDERQVGAVLDEVEPFARNLAATGRPPGGRRSILRLIGRALLVQQRVAGRIAIRDKPDVLWDRPDLERLYSRLEDEYELIERAETLDRKLATIAASATALIDLKDAARALRLELTIILLILAELAIGLWQLFGRLRP